MHMSDALVSPAVAVCAGVTAFGLLAVASKKTRSDHRADLVSTMGVMGAFVFAAQMINFTIPGTGSSGHIIGGVLLSVILGSWAAFITLSSVLIVQCLVFADGGLMALGCNIINMAAASCLIGYPLFYKPVAGSKVNPFRIFAASVLACVVSLEIGAFGVTLETELSGITALPMVTFLKFMLPIHLAIGLVEGIATGAVLTFVARNAPAFLVPESSVADTGNRTGVRKPLLWFLAVALALGALFTWIASSNPDGLEWSVEKAAEMFELDGDIPSTAVLPGYNSSFAGIIGALIVMAVLWAFTSLAFSRIRKEPVGDKSPR